MHPILDPKPATAQLRPQAAVRPVFGPAPWSPQSCGLTREELRRIVLAAIG